MDWASRTEGWRLYSDRRGNKDWTNVDLSWCAAYYWIIKQNSVFFILLCQIQTIRFDKENSLHPIRACLAYPNRISKNDPDNEVTQTEIRKDVHSVLWLYVKCCSLLQKLKIYKKKQVQWKWIDYNWMLGSKQANEKINGSQNFRIRYNSLVKTSNLQCVCQTDVFFNNVLSVRQSFRCSINQILLLLIKRLVKREKKKEAVEA